MKWERWTKLNWAKHYILILLCSMWCDMKWCVIHYFLNRIKLIVRVNVNRCDINWCEVSFCDIMWNCVMWRSILRQDVKFCDLPFCKMMSCNVKWRNVTWHDVTVCDDRGQWHKRAQQNELKETTETKQSSTELIKLHQTKMVWWNRKREEQMQCNIIEKTKLVPWTLPPLKDLLLCPESFLCTAWMFDRNRRDLQSPRPSLTPGHTPEEEERSLFTSYSS